MCGQAYTLTHLHQYLLAFVKNINLRSHWCFPFQPDTAEFSLSPLPSPATRSPAPISPYLSSFASLLLGCPRPRPGPDLACSTYIPCRLTTSLALAPKPWALATSKEEQGKEADRSHMSSRKEGTCKERGRASKETPRGSIPGQIPSPPRCVNKAAPGPSPPWRPPPPRPLPSSEWGCWGGEGQE